MSEFLTLEEAFERLGISADSAADATKQFDKAARTVRKHALRWFLTVVLVNLVAGLLAIGGIVFVVLLLLKLFGVI